MFNRQTASKWRPETQVVIYDPTQADVYPLTTTLNPVKSTGPAASVVYGRGFGDYFAYRDLVTSWVDSGDLEGLELR